MTSPLLGFDLVDHRKAMNRLDLMGGLIGTFACDGDLINLDRTTRRFYYRGARYRDGLGGVSFEPDGFIVCTDNAISFVQWDSVGGVIIGATLDPLKYAIAEVTCASGSLTHVEDIRDANLHDSQGLSLDDLLDVDIYDPADGNVLVYDEYLGLWVNGPSSGSGSMGVQDEGVDVVVDAAVINFVGAGVEVTDVGGVPTVEVLASPGPGGGVLDFPDRIPDTPSQYDEEGDQGSLDASWTETSTPHASYVRETNRDGTWIGMSGPGNATHTWTLRKPIDNADGDYPTAFTLTAKIAVSSANVGSAILIGVGNHATFLTNTYVIFGLLSGAGLVSEFYSDFNAAPVTLGLSAGLREIYVHLQRNTAATNNVRLYISISGRAWVLVRTITTTANFDYLWLYFQGGGGGIPVALWTNYERVNDPRFLQPE